MKDQMMLSLFHDPDCGSKYSVRNVMLDFVSIAQPQFGHGSPLAFTFSNLTMSLNYQPLKLELSLHWPVVSSSFNMGRLSRSDQSFHQAFLSIAKTCWLCLCTQSTPHSSKFHTHRQLYEPIYNTQNALSMLSLLARVRCRFQCHN